MNNNASYHGEFAEVSMEEEVVEVDVFVAAVEHLAKHGCLPIGEVDTSSLLRDHVLF